MKEWRGFDKIQNCVASKRIKKQRQIDKRKTKKNELKKGTDWNYNEKGNWGKEEEFCWAPPQLFVVINVGDNN